MTGQIEAKEKAGQEFDSIVSHYGTKLTKKAVRSLRDAYIHAAAGPAGRYESSINGFQWNEKANRDYRIYTDSWVLPRIIDAVVGRRA